jgi:hypothetical protein
VFKLVVERHGDRKDLVAWKVKLSGVKPRCGLCKTEFANSSNLRISVYCTIESANFARLANSTIFHEETSNSGDNCLWCFD